ncbi:MAG: hypothetical protein SD837_12395 [Candidatus Electrothrix scaldis]|nr:MAG: hypothetical protein SD837_12395 [Candidatus Electrothrix sp. GW3-3]
MLYTIVQPFGSDDGERWTGYCQWRGLEFKRFDSIDGILRPSLLRGPEDADWPHIVNQDFMLHFIKDLEYACHKLEQIGKGEIVGVELEDHKPDDQHFLGYDILDGYFDVSLLTNWGNDIALINDSLMLNGLVADFDQVNMIHQYLVSNYGDDDHVKGACVVSLYRAGYREG